MQTVSFLSSNPFDHVQRALDMLRKMHFGLVRLSVEPSDSGFIVVITFEENGRLAVDILIDRLVQLDGLISPPTLTAVETESHSFRQVLHAAAARH